MPALLMTRASVPTAVPIARKSVLLKEVELVMPAGKLVGHLGSPLLSTAQHFGALEALLKLWYGHRETPCKASDHHCGKRAWC